MSNPAKVKGAQFERDVVRAFVDRGFMCVERRYGAGRVADEGDLTGFTLPLVVECKNVARVDLATIVDEARREAATTGQRTSRPHMAVSIIKRRGKGAERAYCVLEFEDFARLLGLAGCR